MIEGVPKAMTVLAIVGSGLVAGVFFAFSTFIMKALGRLPATQSLAAMQAINRAAPSAWFMGALFVTALVSIGLVVVAIANWGERYSVYLLVGSGLYLAAIVLTIVYHVPRNDALALLDPNAVGAAADWTRYLSQWTAWNHVRTLTSVASVVSFTLALRA